ncbi:putative cytochrome P450 hydroxylase [Streptomyces sp. L-9-10]|uniref:DUF2637 domain-containing protein n=1 Tax=Streptomyces sp. L-9-10 TaxID=1478131 RepID=UPI00101E1A96|nr:DUF2637 domain-containing protein [Streptomyces sp. L-9-10]RYJ30704.1 putative cytochrome P450 hydroxylase [Streptomyces sp. L-9-10]
MTKHAAERYALAAAGVVIVALTVGAFWLSYAHLAEVAGKHGLGGSPTRQWAWPATVDAFIVAGELLMLRAGLRRVTDGWAIALTATGSVGSIALNVAGVSGTAGSGTVPLLDYVVAAVPPTAALLAFGVLMRQIHQGVDQPTGHPDTTSDQPADLPTTAVAEQPEPPALVVESEPLGGSPALTGLSGSPARPVPEVVDTVSAQDAAPRRTGRPPNASLDELLAIARPVAERLGGVDRDVITDEIRIVQGRKAANERLLKVFKVLEEERDSARPSAQQSG